jgi:hypothetical protein
MAGVAIVLGQKMRRADRPMEKGQPMSHDRLRRRRGGISVETLEGRVLLSTLPAARMMMRPTAEVRAATSHRSELPGPTASRWAWLTNTYWYVPNPNLSAVVFDPSTGALASVQDQTVYHISGYRNGYFWGETVTQLGQSAPTSSALVGSVTPQGRLLLSFTSSGNSITGYGVMTRKAGGWTMENQMFSITSDAQVGHWAYMVQTRPGMRSWASLPAVNVSVPTFLSNYNASVPTPIVRL